MSSSQFRRRKRRFDDDESNSVSADARQPAIRKVVRIRAEQFAVQG
jgi:hypothetical protein